MRKAADGKPVVWSTGKVLGVRAHPMNGVQDVDLDDGGNVVLNGKGCRLPLDGETCLPS